MLDRFCAPSAAKRKFKINDIELADGMEEAQPGLTVMKQLNNVGGCCEYMKFQPVASRHARGGNAG